MAEVVERLRPYVLGWKAYFGLAQTPRIWRELDEWMRHRPRAIQLKHWKRGKTLYRELGNLNALVHVAQRVAANSRRWWRNSDGDIKRVLTHHILRSPYAFKPSISNVGNFYSSS